MKVLFWMRKILISLLVIAFPMLSVFAQTRNISGVVRDSETNEPLPFVNVVIKNTTIGTITDTAGVFLLKTSSLEANLVISTLGYQPFEYTLQPNQTSKIMVELTPDNIALNEVTVSPDDSQVRSILNKMVDNKGINNPEKHQRYAYQKYSKWEY